MGLMARVIHSGHWGSWPRWTPWGIWLLATPSEALRRPHLGPLGRGPGGPGNACLAANHGHCTLDGVCLLGGMGPFGHFWGWLGKIPSSVLALVVPKVWPLAKMRLFPGKSPSPEILLGGIPRGSAVTLGSSAIAWGGRFSQPRRLGTHRELNPDGTRPFVD